MTHARVTAALAISLAILGALVSSAFARNFSVSSASIRATYRSVEFGGGFGTTHCDLSLEGSLHSRTIAKVLRSLIGYITRAIIQKPCLVGDFTVLAETLPWHMRYAGFTGTLPNISSFATNIVGLSLIAIEPSFGFGCLFRTTAESPAIGTYNREAGGALTTALISGTIPTSCGLNISVSGTSSMLTLLGATSRLTVTLI
jgi:hypothetical protein